MRSVAFLLLFLSILMAAISGPSPARAQGDQPDRPFPQALAQWQRDLDRASQSITQSELSDSEVDAARGLIEGVRSQALAARALANAKLDPVRTLLKTLGPAPTGGASEPAQIAQQRENLAGQIADGESQVKQCDLIVARAEGMLADLSTKKRAQLAERLLTRGPSPLSREVIGKAVPQALAITAALVKAPAVGWNSAAFSEQRSRSLLIVGLAIVISIAVGWPLRLWLLRRFGRDPAVNDPSYARRVLAAAIEGLAGGLLPALAASLALAIFDREELITGVFAQMIVSVIGALVIFILCSALIGAALAPTLPAWRLSGFTDRSARRLSQQLTILAAVLAVIYGVARSAQGLQPAPGIEVKQLASLIIHVALACLIVSTCRQRNWERAPDPDQGETGDAIIGGPFWSKVRPVIAGLAVLAPLADLAGYRALAEFLMTRIILSSLLITLTLLARALISEIVVIAVDSPSAMRFLALDPKASRRTQFWVLLVVDIGMCVLGVLLMMLIWGGNWDDIATATGRVMRGVSVGEFTFSPAGIVEAIVTFILVVGATRLTQRFVAEKILPQTRLDSGVRDSLRAGIGYGGTVLALALGVAALGIDLQNIAIIAGALSVGIGFGLQNIVNNFVSGLLLLIERPIKVNDWVVVGTSEGYVRRINVRATELQTFDGASVIIPNSQLIAQPVMNWTYKDRRCRAEVRVGVNYGANVEKVREILLDCAKAHPKTALWPEPQVLFSEFGASALNFVLRAYLDDVDFIAQVPSDLRFAIYRQFHESGIEFPKSQQELRIKEVIDVDPRTAKVEIKARPDPADEPSKPV